MAQKFLIIDGYNLMHAAGMARERYGPGDLERCRERLLRFLHSRLTAEERKRTTIVFDAWDPPPLMPEGEDVEVPPDLIFLDPPFAENWQQRLADGLPGVLADQALVYYESAGELMSLAATAAPAGEPNGIFRRIRHDRAGQVHYHLFSFESGKDS